MATLVVAWLMVFEAQNLVNRSGDITKVVLTAAFVFATIFLLVCYYFVSAKLFSGRGRPADFALFLPAAVFVAAAFHWLGPSLVEIIPDWLHYIVGFAAVLIFAWNVIELGILPDRSRP
jgi:hypothetical protein